MEIDKKLLKEIKDFCKVNNIEDVEGKINSMLRKELMLLKYGSSPFSNPETIQEEPVKEEKKPKRGRKKKEEIKTGTEFVEEPVKEEPKTEEIKEEKVEPVIAPKKRVIKITKK